MALPTVLVDATPLAGSSGVRGIGQFVRYLLQGLVATHAEWRNELRILALYDLALPARHAFSDDLVQVAERAFEQRGAESLLPTARRLLLPRAVRAAGANLLHVTEAFGTPLLTSTPRIVTCHDLIPLVYPEHYYRGGPPQAWVRKLRDQVRYRSARRVVCISRRTASDLQRLLGISGERVVVIPQGIDVARFSAPASVEADAAHRAELGVGRRPYLVYAGYSDYRKNVEGMLGALARVRTELDVELAWAGHLPPERLGRVVTLARKLGVEDSVRFLGFVADEHMPSLFRGALAHLFLSRLEGFGLSVAEAMAAGCPVIVARSSGADEVAADAALAVDADDTQAAADAILTLARSEKLATELIARGKARVLGYERETMARAYVGIYRNVSAR